ncbi:alpha/beta fold hydrolase [Salinibacterium sp. SWN1162]|uniref:alpha/beta fold hydrolase n=1 Tax=Salinibacterium sp. SWN1162 TaxID=2792053 RepID=UPI0018CFDCFF|nr:alpha/beta hydrolase [Salinibacterium sp. SWN1162]MBH0009362.1 alpha/beta hydrolase [Salinibacterium sp. SWN1162]
MKPASPYGALLDANPARRSEVAVLGASTHYWEYGPADADTVLVLVHGFRGDHHGLEAVCAHIRGIRIISPDLPAFGSSEPLEGYVHDIDGYARWLEAFVEQLGLSGRAYILGHSFGSIVVSAALARGLNTPKLILVNPIAAPALAGPNGVLSRITLWFYQAARALPLAIGSSMLSNWLVVRVMSLAMVKTKDPELRRWVHQQHHAHFSSYADRDSLLEAFEASIGSDVSMYAEQITVPTLLIGARNDPISPVPAQERVHTLFADSQLAIFDDVGHLIHYERPREAAELIVRFLGAGTVAEPRS